MKKFEYKIIKRANRFDDDDFEYLGEEGWELVAVTVNNSFNGHTYVAYFKRELETTKE